MNASSKPASWQIWLILTAGILSVSTAAIFIRLAFAAVDSAGVGFSLVLAASRLTLAALFLLPTWHNFQVRSLQRSALLYSATAGVFLAVHFAAWITSLAYTSIVASATLVTTNPVWVALISWVWFREKPSWITSGGIGLALLGSVLVAIGGSGSDSVGSHPLLGNGLALVGSIAISFYFLIGREAQRRGLGIGNHVAIAYATAAIVLLPLPLLFRTGYTGYSAQVYVAILLMALFPQLIGHTSFNWAVRWISPTLVTLTILAEPIGASILGMIIFQETPSWAVALGALIILAGVAIAAVGTRSEEVGG
jgi:drug/metabolite transporter (DMT)-like permease